MLPRMLPACLLWLLYTCLCQRCICYSPACLPACWLLAGRPFVSPSLPTRLPTRLHPSCSQPGTFLGGALMLHYGRRAAIGIDSLFFIAGPLIMALALGVG